ncbi:hypothetical protein [Acidianus sp. HS-5]|uniref:hypothetical protein n=1 Tax=Acidianus sp. HS-5 TaxID=2886040 RepID=UPI001F27518A|nr:hypothetical protein [Acidianus sp. HS-5]BDC17356.1 hypothetical protein HS5_02460 [Acidianus sp. HS-5]
MNVQSVSNAASLDNMVSNASLQPVYLVVLDNEAGIVIKFGERWSKIEYHEGRIIIYRNDQGNISILEIEYDE